MNIVFRLTLIGLLAASCGREAPLLTPKSGEIEAPTFQDKTDEDGEDFGADE